MKRYIKQYFSSFAYFYSILRSRLLVVIGFSIVVGLLDSLGLTMFLPLLQLADGGDAVDMGNLSVITNFLSSIGITLTVNKALLFLVIIFLLKGSVVYRASVYRILTQQRLTKKVRMSIVDLLPLFAYNQFVKTDIGKIQNIFLGEIVRLSNTYTNYVSMIQGSIMIIVYMLFSFLVDWQFALLVCLGGLLSNLIFSQINKLTKEKSKNISKVGNAFSNVLIQYVHNFKYLKATGKVMDYKNKVEKSIDHVQYESLQMGMLNSKVSAYREPMLICIVVLVIFAQITFFDARISAIMISLLFFYRALTSVVSVQNSYNNTLANQGAIDNITSFLLELKTYKEKVGKRIFEGLQHSITIKDVVFKYDDTTILNKINISIPKNSTIAFVGESGSGKTTLVNTIIRLLNVHSGEILIDGVDIKQFNQFTYQKKIGYISQEATVFNATIFENITFWAEPTDYNISRFQAVVKMASLSDFIDGLKLKEQALLGNNGVNLSGGQRQRISIARELFKEVEILILDEATSALDSETENEIQQNIDALKGKFTLLIIAHRLATIKNADTIYLMDKGTITGQGNFSELTSSSERFKRMVELQEI
ncbi:subfamily B ATP-binding cassette protein MsbA [Flavobacterium arsenatis]|uniref:Subfamily B ATP-binding cassette protein MsbA n=1 Tax=Flavobacterium arsenatis TaxID=1484332 RepID=A0ABU1TM94_9FLAO|nr:ABC transporter ATP-binding protein [Flavobacterium arsenatis]MDR6966986.1 subfamily B ATP-binding cassette protein MsbA [Flavobacterium arsenatis]